MLPNGQPEYTNQEIKKLQEAAKRYAIARKRPQLADDFAQEYVIVKCVKGWMQTIEQAFIDFLSKEYGSYRSNSGRAKSRGVHTSLSLDQPVSQFDSETPLSDLIGDVNGTPPDAGLDKRDPIYFGKSFIRNLIFDYTCMGLSQIDIAELLGLTETRISQYLKEIKKNASDSEIYTIKEEFDLGLRSYELKVDWIAI